jgi:transcriptional regulator with XRE-family HTH domain
MNALEIKENRKKLGITQKELANLIGVSTQTINGYENGKEIPSTKHQILYKILKVSELENTNVLAEESEIYLLEDEFEEKIKEVNQLIDEHKNIIKLLEQTNNKEKADHHKKMVELLKQQIEIIRTAKINFYLNR